MARKDSSATSSESSHHGWNDVFGILLVAAAVLLAVSQWSFDPRDIPSTTTAANDPAANWVGPFGAHFAYGLFFAFGAAAFIIPPLLGVFALGCFFKYFIHLRRRWPAALLLLLSSVGLLDYYDGFAFLTRGAQWMNAPGAGGLAGQVLNKYLLVYVGKGAVVIHLALYFISLIFLTNFKLGDWLRELVSRVRMGDADSEEEAGLNRRSRDLEKQAKKLQEKVDRVTATQPPDKLKEVDAEAKPSASKLGADLQPIPEPTIRDLSMTMSRPAKAFRKPEPGDSAGDSSDGLAEGEVISAREIAAATSGDILGNKSKLTPPSRHSKSASGPEADWSPSGAGKTPEPSAGSVAPVVSPVGESESLPGVPPAALPTRPKFQPRRNKPITVASTPMIGNYKLPTMDFLQHPEPVTKPTESKEELMANAKLMQSTLAQFDIEVALGDITKGPTITRYELHPAPGVRLEKITALNNNIAAALKAERINILAPVPGKSSVGVEVPNAIKTKVIMRDLLQSEEWQNTKARIPLALGKDVYGHPIIADLAEMPHLLIAGSTGSGKSVCINSIIASLLYRFSPDQLRFVMIDPKVVELQQYNALPHLVVPVVNDPKKVILALRWVVNEMEKRYQIFAKVGVRNIKSFNERPKDKPVPQPEPELPLTVNKEKIEAGADGFAVELDEEIVVPREDDIVIPEKLSYIVVIIDELADLMLVAPADVEMAIARITQMARAAGIHCIVATQRPSVDVITGVIKANIPARIAFQVAAKVDSRTILDAMGADKLLGKGDMLYLPPGSARLIRAQGVLITDGEIQSVVDSIARQGKPSYELEITQQLSKPAPREGSDEGCDEDEDLIQQCVEVIRSEQKASVSLMQRRLRLGYTRAARIMDELENRGIVGPSKGAEPRDILIDLDGGGADGGSQQAV